MHHDFCAVAMARLKVEYLLGIRALLRSLHERLVTMMESFMVPLRGLVSTLLITNADYARLQGCLPTIRDEVAQVLRQG